MKNFAITGVGGYIAPRHLKAIKETENDLLAAIDPHDSVGVLDGYFPRANFFTEFERFDRHIEMLRRSKKGKRVDYLSICSPNYLHDAHIRFALRIGANVICEKPLVINPWNLEALQLLEEESGCQINTVLQLRLHPSLIDLKKKLLNTNKKVNVSLTYITSRGKWYEYSWKGNNEKSGGIVTNIGIHFFDLLIWLFGDVLVNQVHLYNKKKAGGFIELKNAYVQWFLSIDMNDVPTEELNKGRLTYRSMKVEGEEVQFNDGFTELHTNVYKEILAGNGFRLKDAYPSIELVHNIRKSPLYSGNETMHYMTRKYINREVIIPAYRVSDKSLNYNKELEQKVKV